MDDPTGGAAESLHSYAPLRTAERAARREQPYFCWYTAGLLEGIFH